MIDINCFIGRWPFAKSKSTFFDDLKRIHDKYNIAPGPVSSLESILYNDPFEGDLELSKVLNGSGYEPAVCINPLLPNIQRDIRKADESFEYSAFRVYPTIHGYGLDSSEFMDFMEMAKEKEKTVLIACLFGDYRLDYVIKQRQTDLKEMKTFLENHNGAKTVLCSIKLSEIDIVGSLIKEAVNVFIDMAELRHSIFALQDLEKVGLSDKILFGSSYPINDFYPAYIHFEGVDKMLFKKIDEKSI